MSESRAATILTKKRVYLFEEGNADMRDLLGGKGAGLAEMTRAGLPVPPGFTITTSTCNEYTAGGEEFPEGLKEEMREALKAVEQKVGRTFGDVKNPLLLSVRSGAKFSMPGMMDTILNLGLNQATLQGIIEGSKNQRFAYDAYRRLIQMFGNVVLGIEKSEFEHALTLLKEQVGARQDTDLTLDHLQELVRQYKEIIWKEAGREFPQDPWEQLYMATEAVFKSWNNKRAIAYRNEYKIPHDLGTAVNIQAMVFGNMGEDCATGVAFTRNPSTGEKILYGEYLVNAQGEDVVAGIRTPKSIGEMTREMPEVSKQFNEFAGRLEKHYRDMQDLEFTIERGRLWMLQTRTGKRTAPAALRMAADMANEGLISKDEALLRIDPQVIDQLLHPQIDPTADLRVIAKGLNASPGSAVGVAVFDPDRAEHLAKTEGVKVILVRNETNPDDIHGMIASQGILTSRGGMTSHAAVVARGMGKPCVAGCESLLVDLENRCFTAPAGIVVNEGDPISINGTTGEVILGEAPLIEPELTAEFYQIMSWADERRRLKVRTNGDTPADATKARELGAEGIGLCRTEHMFFAPERLPWVQRMILADSVEERRMALDKLLPMQVQDFKGILRAMQGLPVTIRLLDPPLHEFLPNRMELQEEVLELRYSVKQLEAQIDKYSILTVALEAARAELARREELLRKVETLHEANPMLGLRGCRLGLVHPEINEMQVRAIFEAAIDLTREGIKVLPEIMIPLVGMVEELQRVREQLEAVAKQCMEEADVQVDYMFGTMIEIPRAALTADEIAQQAEFFSFGTNDLTQMTFGYSRDDAEGKFLFRYLEQKILQENPFEVIDRAGVGSLIRMGVEKGRSTRPNLKIGICGEHGGNPSSIEFCHLLGLDYVSCSPYRVPIARLAAAQAAIAGEKDRSASQRAQL